MVGLDHVRRYTPPSKTVTVTKDDKTVSTSWQLSCVEDEDMKDLLALIVTGRGEIHVSEACRAL